ncbi:MAG: polysaccharide biosynthesis tyrosine autokinase [Dorea sp.]|nr:polysaccharide biosynthesis tyrosine autokinase [Dorea sp.]
MNNRDNHNGSVLAEYGIEPFTLVTDVLKNTFYILLGAVAIALLAAVITSYRYQPEYTSTATFVVNNKESNNNYMNLTAANKMALMMEKILGSTLMEKEICEVLGIEREAFDADISANVIGGTNLLELSVTANNPKEAIDIIQTVMDNYKDVELFTISGAAMDILQPPLIPHDPDNPLNLNKVIRDAFLLGALLWIFLFGICSYLLNTIKQESDVEKKLDCRSLGAIPFEKKNKTITAIIGKKNKKALLVDDPMKGFNFVESYKKLASKIEYTLSRKNMKSIVVTSVSENEGKSTVAANIAISLAGQGNTVVLIDGDIRRPSQFLVFGMKPEEDQEIGEYLLGNTDMNNILLKTNRKDLFFIGGKGCYSSSTEMLHTERLPLLMKRLEQIADYIVIDTPPAGLIGDSQVFAHYADAVVLVVKQNMVLAEDINDAIDDFRDSNNTVLGVVLNHVRSSKTLKVTGYGTYGHYGKYKAYTKGK